MASKPKPSRHAPEEIDAYLDALPADRQRTLARVRTIIREIAPDCTERVSYQIPIFRLGKDLVGVSSQKNHCALHSMSPQLLKAMADDLQGVKVSGATIRFTADNPLPKDLIEKIVLARIKEIETA